MKKKENPGYLPEEYYTDNYPRNGCNIIISLPDEKDGKYRVSIQAPEKYGNKQLESYLTGNLESGLGIAKMLATGNQVPKGYNQS